MSILRKKKLPEPLPKRLPYHLIQIRCPVDEYQDISFVAKDLGLNVTAVARHAIKSFVDEYMATSKKTRRTAKR